MEGLDKAMIAIAKRAREKQLDGQELDPQDLAALKHVEGLTHPDTFVFSGNN